MGISRRSMILGACAGIGAAMLEPASGADSPEAEARLHTDWPYLMRYREENEQLKADGKPVDVVFLGDSITEGWLQKAPEFFIDGRICRGIGGQTTPQM